MEVVTRVARETVEAVEGVYLTQLAVGDRASVQQFHIEPGAVVPEHSHEHEQVGYVTGGSGVFLVDGEELTVGPGDSYVLPSAEPHGVENRGDDPLEGVDVFAPPRANPDWMD